MTKDEIKNSDFLYAQEFFDNIDQVRELIRDGEITVIVDYNRSGWHADKPHDSVIYRIKVLK